jgi:hypothetical protein
MSNHLYTRLLNQFDQGHQTEIERPLLAAVTIGVSIMSLTFLLGAALSFPLAVFGTAWGADSVALLSFMTGGISTAMAVAVFLRHNYRISQHSSQLPFALRAWEMVCAVASAMFCGLCFAVISVVVTFFIGVFLLSFSGGSTDQQRQLIVYPPIIACIPAFVVGAIWFFIREYRRERNWLRQAKSHPSH